MLRAGYGFILIIVLSMPMVAVCQSMQDETIIGRPAEDSSLLKKIEKNLDDIEDSLLQPKPQDILPIHLENLQKLQDLSIANWISINRPPISQPLIPKFDSPDLMLKLKRITRPLGVEGLKSCTDFRRDSLELIQLEKQVSALYQKYFDSLQADAKRGVDVSAETRQLSDEIIRNVRVFRTLVQQNMEIPDREVQYSWEFPDQATLLVTLGNSDVYPAYSLSAAIQEATVMYEGVALADLKKEEMTAHLPGFVGWSLANGGQQISMWDPEPLAMSGTVKSTLSFRLTPYQACAYPAAKIGMHLNVKFDWTIEILKKTFQQMQCTANGTCGMIKPKPISFSPKCMVDGCGGFHPGGDWQVLSHSDLHFRKQSFDEFLGDGKLKLNIKAAADSDSIQLHPTKTFQIQLLDQ